jgi:ATP synthase protein I
LNKETKSKSQNPNTYLKYSGIAFQLAALVLLAFYGGRWVDQKIGNTQPFIGMAALLIVFSAFMYKLYKDLFK